MHFPCEGIQGARPRDSLNEAQRARQPGKSASDVDPAGGNWSGMPWSRLGVREERSSELSYLRGEGAGVLPPRLSAAIGRGCSQGAVPCQHVQQPEKGLGHRQMDPRRTRHDGGCCHPSPPKLGAAV